MYNDQIRKTTHKQRVQNLGQTPPAPPPSMPSVCRWKQIYRDTYLGNTGGLKINSSSSCFLIHRNNLLTAEIATFFLTNGLNIAYNSKPEVTCKNMVFVIGRRNICDLVLTADVGQGRCRTNLERISVLHDLHAIPVLSVPGREAADIIFLMSLAWRDWITGRDSNSAYRD